MAQLTIPTDNPNEALEFCKRLATLLSDEHTQPEIEQSHIPPTISVVIPVYEEKENLPVLYNRLTNVLSDFEPNYEIILVDDGSRDGSAALMREMARQDAQITVIELSRNFGHQIAISAGLDYARGEAVVIMDADLQDPPEVLPQFIQKWRDGYDVVYAIRRQRKEIWIKRTSYAIFYRLLQRIASIEIPLDAGDFCIMDRRVVNILTHMPERNRFVRGIRSWVGLKQVGLAYDRDARNAGKPKFTFSRLLYLALDGLVSFSFLPLRVITVIGFIVSIVSILLAIFYTIQKVTIGLNPPGFATLVVAILFLSGMQLMTIGLIGEYVGRIFEEVKQRPLYVVSRVVKGEAA